jgi:hypothetical protein
MPEWKMNSGGRGEMERNKMKKALAESWRRHSMILENVGKGKPPVASLFSSR